jgi:hypothetical protein
MKTVEGVCKELKSLHGVVGAFVLQQDQCLGSSLPPQYDPKRLVQVGAILASINQISQKAGYQRSATAFHWQRASLLTWPLGDNAMLGLLATPNVVRETINMSASIALEDLGRVFESEAGRTRLEPLTPPPPVVPAPPGQVVITPIADEGQLGRRLQSIECLVIEELGPSGKPLFERCLNKTPRGNASASAWLLSFRNAILSDIVDPGARVTIATCHYWAPIE